MQERPQGHLGGGRALSQSGRDGLQIFMVLVSRGAAEAFGSVLCCRGGTTSCVGTADRSSTVLETPHDVGDVCVSSQKYKCCQCALLFLGDCCGRCDGPSGRGVPGCTLCCVMFACKHHIALAPRRCPYLSALQRRIKVTSLRATRPTRGGRACTASARNSAFLKHTGLSLAHVCRVLQA